MGGTGTRVGTFQIYLYVQKQQIIKIKDQQGENLLGPKNLFVQIFATKAVQTDPENFHLEDIGISGDNILPMQNGQAFFSTIKFKSTTYNHDGQRFHLVVCIYIQNADDEQPRILTSTISPPIFVDSRNSDKERLENNEKRFQFIEPFGLENLDKSYFKRENKKKSEHEIKIDEDLSSLYNYFSAPNIRHKVKHPIFLAIKFPQVVTLYYNTKLVEVKDLQQLVIKIQRLLSNENIFKTCSQENITEFPFILKIQNNNEQIDEAQYRKVTDQIDTIQSQNIAIVHQFNNKELSEESFKNISTFEENLADCYKDTYLELVQINKELNSDDDQDESLDKHLNNKDFKMNYVPDGLSSKQQEKKQKQFVKQEPFDQISKNQMQKAQSQLNQFNNNTVNNYQVHINKTGDPNKVQNGFQPNQQQGLQNMQNPLLNNQMAMNQQIFQNQQQLKMYQQQQALLNLQSQGGVPNMPQFNLQNIAMPMLINNTPQQANIINSQNNFLSQILLQQQQKNQLQQNMFKQMQLQQQQLLKKQNEEKANVKNEEK